MHKRIAKICKSLEKEKTSKILFAIENGSRAWRMHSKDSDYDVRYVFVRQAKEYLRLDNPKSVITTCFDEEGNPHPQKDSFIDMTGFDLFKFLRLLSASNPTCIEWLVSDIVYHGKQPKGLQQWAKKEFNPTALVYHYKSLAKKNFVKYIQSGSQVTYKKYLYPLRGIFNAQWVLSYDTVPPIKFTKTLDGMSGIINKRIINQVHTIIKKKAEGKEKDPIKNIKVLDSFIRKFLEKDHKPKLKKANKEQLNKELAKILKIK